MTTFNHKDSFCEKFKLDPDHFPLIEDVVTFESIEDDRILMRAGDTNRNLYLIIKGSGVAYGITDSGDVKNVHLQRESNIITSITSIFDNEPSKHYCEVFADSEIVKISIDDLERIAKESLPICNWYNRLLKRSISIFSFRLEGLLMKNATDRLLEYYEKDPERFTSSLKKHLAGILGITPNSLSRILSSKIVYRQQNVYQ